LYRSHLRFFAGKLLKRCIVQVRSRLLCLKITLCKW
jgi:hypothetical protein